MEDVAECDDCRETMSLSSLIVAQGVDEAPVLVCRPCLISDLTLRKWPDDLLWEEDETTSLLDSFLGS